MVVEGALSGGEDGVAGRLFLLDTAMSTVHVH